MISTSSLRLELQSLLLPVYWTLVLGYRIGISNLGFFCLSFYLKLNLLLYPLSHQIAPSSVYLQMQKCRCYPRLFLTFMFNQLATKSYSFYHLNIYQIYIYIIFYPFTLPLLPYLGLLYFLLFFHLFNKCFRVPIVFQVLDYVLGTQ